MKGFPKPGKSTLLRHSSKADIVLLKFLQRNLETREWDFFPFLLSPPPLLPVSLWTPSCLHEVCEAAVIRHYCACTLVRQPGVQEGRRISTGWSQVSSVFQQVIDFCANDAQNEKVLCSLCYLDLGVFTKGTVQGKGMVFFLKAQSGCNLENYFIIKIMRRC